MLRHIRLLVLLPLAGCASTPLIQATRQRDIAAVQALLDQGADVDKYTASTMSPIAYAADQGNEELVRLFIDHGADVDSSGIIPPVLSIALNSKNDAVVKMLLAAGANTRRGVYGKFTYQPHDAAKLAKFLKEIRAERGETRPPKRATAARSPTTASAVRSDVDTPGYQLPERSDDFAIVVGIDDYKDLPDAKFAERDAEAMRKHLVAMGYPERQIVLLKGANATRTGLLKYLEEWLPRNVTPASNVFFYYSGHGAPDMRTGKAYLVPWDGDASFLKSTAYPVEKLYASLNSLKAKQVVVVLDACFSGAGGRSVLAEGARPLVTRVKTAVPKGKLVAFTAASANEITTTLKDYGHGIFTYYFLKGINGAAKDDAGRVTAKSLYRYLKPKVQREARLQNREQTPTIQYKSNVVFRPR